MSMTERVVPMIHVPDVRAAAAWYESIGFRARHANIDPDGHMDWASLSFGSTEIMLNEGGRPSSSHRREVDLYIQVDDVQGLYERLRDRVEVVEAVHDTFYGMREFTIRDLNRFWITFGQSVEAE
jgi:uncharacterized glyoxalase superfamily protein PhnB